MSNSPRLALSSESRSKIDAILADVVEKKSMPAVFMTACSADEVLYENQGGYVDFDKPDAGRVNADTILHLFSMSKFITSIACHQLVDRGLFRLDDPEIVAKYCPEIALDKLQILEGYEGDEPKLRPAKTPITLAMLLSHSAGFCYTWSAPNGDIAKWREQHKKPDYFSARSYDDYVQPLIYEPGSSYTYSIGVDWAGFMVERATGQGLEQYMRENIFDPVGATSMTFYPTKEVLGRLMKPCSMDQATGELKGIDGPPIGKPLTVDEIKVPMPGGGLLGTTRDYLKVLQGVLRSSPTYHSPPPKPLLSPASFEAIFKPVLPTSEGTTAIAGLKKMLTGQWYQRPLPSLDNVQHSAGLALYPGGGEFGRAKGSGCWDGAFKTVFWIDPVTGIAAECNTSVNCPSNENAVGRTLNAFEKTLYEGFVKGA